MKQLALLLASFLLCAAAHAAPPSDASLDALFEASHARKTLDSVYPMVEQAFRQGLESTRGAAGPSRRRSRRCSTACRRACRN